MRAMALRVAGRLVEATEASEQAYAELLPRRAAAGIAVEANSLGLIWLARGRARTALRFCRESAALLRDGDAVGMLPFALAGVAQAAAQAGDAETAREAVEEMERTPLGHKGFAIVVELARAWARPPRASSRARGSSRARRPTSPSRAGRTPTRSTRCTSWPGSATRPPRPPASPALAPGVDGPFAPAATAHAAALVARDGAALAEVAERFADMGALLVAAEAADAAAAALHDAGRASSARAAAARAAVWLAACEDARPPTMLAAPEAAELTPREREIVLLAAAGASSRDIAERLVISVRTVDNHLQSAYRKLGVSRRQDLARVVNSPLATGL